MALHTKVRQQLCMASPCQNAIIMQISTYVRIFSYTLDILDGDTVLNVLNKLTLQVEAQRLLYYVKLTTGLQELILMCHEHM